MSLAPQFPPDYHAPEERPRRRRPWKRAAAWIGGIVAVLIVLAMAAIYVLVHTNAGRAYVLNITQQKLSAALGTQVRAARFDVSFSGISPTVDIYNVTIAGAPPYPAPPLLQVDHLHAAVQVASVLSRTWYFRDIRLDHPVVHVFVDARGTDNLPQTGAPPSQKQTSVFDLGVRHAQIERGEIYFNDRKSSLTADLHDLSLNSRFHTQGREYSGTLSYRNGHLQYDSYAPLPHDLQASFTADPSAFTLQRAVLRSGHSQFELHATLTDYSQPRLQAQYTAALDAGEFRRILKNASIPTGVINLNGSLAYASRPNQPMLETVAVNGDLSSARLSVTTPSFSGELRDLRAQYKIANGNLAAKISHGQVLGGNLTGAVDIAHFAGVQHGKLDAVLSGASLAQLRASSHAAALQNYSLTGVANVKVDAAWTGSPQNVQAKVVADASAGAAATGPAPAQAAAARTQPPPKPVPVTAHVQLQYNGRTQQIAIAPNSYIRTPQTTLSLKGVYGRGGAVQVQLQSADLRELTSLLPPSTAASVQAMQLAGRAAFTGTVRQTPAGPSIAGQLNATNLQLRGAVFPSLRTQVGFSPSAVSLQNGRLETANGGTLAFNINAPLRNGNLAPGAPLKLDVHGSHLSLAFLQKALGVSVPASGFLALDVSLHGTELAPRGQGKITLTQGKIQEQPIQTATLAFNANGTVIDGNAVLQLPSAGTARAGFQVNPGQRTYSAQLRAAGIQLGQLAAVKARGMNVAGTLNLTAAGQGSFDNPQFTLEVTTPQLKIENQAINALTLRAAVANRVATVAFDSQAINTTLRARATVQLTGSYPIDAAVDTQPIPLGPMVAMYAPAQAANISGETELHATLRGPLKDKAQLTARAVIPVLRVQYKNLVQLAAQNPIQFDYTGGVLHLRRATIAGTDTRLEVEGSVPLADRSQPVHLLLLGSVDLKIAQAFSPDITSSGQLQFNINSFGQTSNPNFQGQVRIVNAGFATAAAPIGLQNGNGVLTLTKDRLNITQFEGTVGGGTVTARGGLVYRPELRFDMAVAGRNVRLLYPEGVREEFNLNLSLNGTPQNALLGGQVRLQNLSFTPDFDLTTLMGSLGGATAPPPTQNFSDNLRLNLSVQSTGGVSLVSRELSLQAAANLRVQGTASQPVILGRINLNGGDLIFQGNRYVLQGGFIDFVNPYQTEPVLNVRASTTIQQYNIHMQFRGPVDHLHTSYTSDPSLPPPDIINLIAFGKTTEASAANPTPPGALGAESLVASQVSGQITSRISRIAGISQLSVDPVLRGSNQTNPGARITVQQRVTGNLFVTFSTDVTSTQNQVIELQYKVSPRLSITGTRNQNGGFGADARIRKTW